MRCSFWLANLRSEIGALWVNLGNWNQFKKYIRFRRSINFQIFINRIKLLFDIKGIRCEIFMTRLVDLKKAKNLSGV